MKGKIEKASINEKEGKTMQKNIVKVLSPKSGGRNLNSVKSEKDLAKFSEKNPMEKEGDRAKDKEIEKKDEKRIQKSIQIPMGIGKSFGNLVIDRKNDEGMREDNEKEKQLMGKIRKDKHKQKNMKKEEKDINSTSDIGVDLQKTKFFRKNTQPETSTNYNYNYSNSNNNNNFNLSISEKKERVNKNQDQKQEDKTKKMQISTFDKDAKIKQLIQKCQSMARQCQKLYEDKSSMKFVIDQLQADKIGLQSKLDKLRNVAAENRKLLKEKAEGFTSSSHQIKVLRGQLEQMRNISKRQIEKIQTGINTDFGEIKKIDEFQNKKQLRQFGVNTIDEQLKYESLNSSVNLDDFLKSNIASDTHEDSSKVQQKFEQKNNQLLKGDNSDQIEERVQNELLNQRSGQEITTLLKKIIEQQNQKLKDREETIYELQKQLNQFYEKLENAGSISALSHKKNSSCSESQSNSSLQNISVQQGNSKNSIQISSSLSLNVNLDTERAVLLQIKQNQNLKTLINQQQRKFYQLKKQLWIKDRDIANLQQQIRLKEILSQAENDRTIRLEQSRKKFSQSALFENEVQFLRSKLKQMQSKAQDLEQKNIQQQILIKALKQKKTIIFK